MVCLFFLVLLFYKNNNESWNSSSQTKRIQKESVFKVVPLLTGQRKIVSKLSLCKQGKNK